MQAQTSPVAQPTTSPAKACYVCGATDAVRVAYWYWAEQLPPSAGKVPKWICRDGCPQRIDAKYAARECAA